MSDVIYSDNRNWANFETWRVMYDFFDDETFDEPMTEKGVRDILYRYIAEDYTSDPILRKWAWAFVCQADLQQVADVINEGANLGEVSDA